MVAVRRQCVSKRNERDSDKEEEMLGEREEWVGKKKVRKKAISCMDKIPDHNAKQRRPCDQDCFLAQFVPCRCNDHILLGRGKEEEK